MGNKRKNECGAPVVLEGAVVARCTTPANVCQHQEGEVLPAEVLFGVGAGKIRQRYIDLLASPDLLNARHLVAWSMAYLECFLPAIDAKLEAGGGLSAPEAEEIRKTARVLRECIETAHKLENGERVTIRIEELGTIIEQITDAVAAEVSDPAVRAAIAARIAKIGGKG